MREWTREERYQTLKETPIEKIKQLEKIVSNCPYRQTFHIQPSTGLLNDPNGFSYYNGRYHLFYQWFPLGSVHGLKYWYHLSSPDLVQWEEHGVGIEPGDINDSHGAYSGTGIVHEKELYLFYTGNVRDENWIRYPKQCLAIMNENNQIIKEEKAVIDCVPDGYTDHFRDPKVFQQNGMYYCLVGAQRDNETGCTVYYESTDLRHWNFKGELKTDLSRFGYMWECPDYFEEGNKGVFILSPQGIEPEEDCYQNIYQSGYLIGNKVDFTEGTFTHGSFVELDRGFDFYAPQTMEDEQGRRILVGWMGLPEIAYPTDKNQWAHCLTLPRVLEISGDKLLQKPVEELKQLRKESCTIEDRLRNEEKSYVGFSGTHYELMCTFGNIAGQSVGVKLRTSKEKETLISYDYEEKKLVFDRSNSGEAFATEYGTVRKCNMTGADITLRIFIDTSSVEIFVNDGEEVFTSRIFPSQNCEGIKFLATGEATLKATIWNV